MGGVRPCHLDWANLKNSFPGDEARAGQVRKANNASLPREARVDAKELVVDYFRPAALRRAAHLAFIASESFRRPAAVRPPPFLPAGFAAGLEPPAFLLAAQRAFMASESLRRPAAVRPPPLLLAGAAAAGALVVPFLFAQRARAAAANFARVAADIGRRPPPERRRDLRSPLELEAPPKSMAKRFSSAEICCLRESACVSF